MTAPAPTYGSGAPNSGWAPNGNVSNDWNGWNFRNQYLNALQQGQGSGAQSASEYAKASAFDPSAAYQTYMGGAQSNFQTSLSKNLKDLAGKAAGAGRLDTGFYDQDQGDVVRQASQDWANTASQAALQTAGLTEQNNQGLLGYNMANSNQYLQLLSGAYDRQNSEYVNRPQGTNWGQVAGQAATAAALLL